MGIFDFFISISFIYFSDFEFMKCTRNTNKNITGKNKKNAFNAASSIIDMKKYP